MKAIVIKSFETGQFEEVETERPALQTGQILVRAAATSINPVDSAVRQGLLEWAKPPLPAILHGDLAGVVEEVAPGVEDFKVGDEIYAYTGGIANLGGVLADFVAVDVRLVAHKPKTVSLAQAAALPTVSITAWLGLIERAKVKPNQTVLVHAGTGGVGQIAIQLAKYAGAKVFATVSSDAKARLARQLGADETINYRTTAVTDYVQQFTGGRGFDVVFDTVGGPNLAKSLEAAAPGGSVILISVEGQIDPTPILFKALTLYGVAMIIPLLTGSDYSMYHRVLNELAGVVDKGFVKPLLDERSFTFAEANEAHRHFDSGQAVGKVILTNQ